MILLSNRRLIECFVCAWQVEVAADTNAIIVIVVRLINNILLCFVNIPTTLAYPKWMYFLHTLITMYLRVTEYFNSRLIILLKLKPHQVLLLFVCCYRCAWCFMLIALCKQCSCWFSLNVLLLKRLFFNWRERLIHWKSFSCRCWI